MNDARGRKYGNADGYDSYMGGWSAALSPMFLDFVGPSASACKFLDVGCGTGNLLAAVQAVSRGAFLCGVDPSPVLLAKAKLRPELAGGTLLEGIVERLPIDDDVMDYTLSMLVLQEFADRPAALREMSRVTRAGGCVAGCQWDFARMPVIATLVHSIETVSPEAARAIAANSHPVFHDEAELRATWQQAGLVDVRTARLVVERVYPAFDDLWRPLLAGSTPSTLALASLPDGDRSAVYQLMQGRLANLRPTDPVAITAEALAVAGTIPSQA
jgi:ubiquinone/menaquinone biosynthesis C-methylase UbiE